MRIRNTELIIACTQDMSFSVWKNDDCSRISKVRFHDLRHTFATIALQNGVDIKTVSGMLGHFSAGFTLDTYAHVTTSAQREAAQTIGNLLSL